MKLKKKGVKYVGLLKNVIVLNKETGETRETDLVGIDYKDGSGVYDMYYGEDISDDKKYEVLLRTPNILGFGGTKVKPLYLEEGWKDNEEDE